MPNTFDSFFGSPIFPILVVAVVLLLLITLCWKRVPADKAMVITGLKKRVLAGRGGIQVPFLETSCTISLEAVSMTTDITEAPSKQGIFVDIAGTAVVKVDSNPEMVLLAVEQFCNGNAERTTQNIRTVVEQILEGKLRGIVSTLTVEQINEDRKLRPKAAISKTARFRRLLSPRLTPTSLRPSAAAIPRSKPPRLPAKANAPN